ncbi:MAG: aromatic ring-opening dioxygenase LigA [Micrococcales bacterium]|nr:aromatic ring-opening dioxygenase LigA [Micrococcales bacterium]
MTTDTTTRGADGGVKVVGILVLVAGIIMIVAGAVTWASVSSHLKNERITVSEDAASQAGKQVAGPLTAYAEAEVIQKHALEATGGKTYAELDREDPLREVAMTGSFLRASLFSSVIAFGVAAMAIGLGVVNVLLGWSLTRLAKR